MKKLLLLASAVFVLAISKAQVNPCQKAGMPYSSVPGDTTITLSSGSQITFNRCEFFDIKDCLEITEITDTAGLRVAGLTMFDEYGNILLTCGMLSIQLGNCGKTCFDVPIKIKTRVRFGDCTGDTASVPNLYVANGSVWSQQPDEKVKRVTENNIRYLEFYSNCSVIINCDVKKPGRKVKFIAPRRSKIESLRIGRNCPLYYFDSKFLLLKRKQKAKVYCEAPDKTMVQAVLVNKDGNTGVTEQKKLSEIKSGKAKIKCKPPKKGLFRRLFDWRPAGKSNTHKKYFLSA